MSKMFGVTMIKSPFAARSRQVFLGKAQKKLDTQVDALMRISPNSFGVEFMD